MDLQHVRLTVVDNKGRRCLSYDDELEFSVTGDASIVAVTNGDIESDELNTVNHRRLWNGSAMVILRAGSQPSKRNSPGTAFVAVPGGVAHTNQLLREWNPMGSFLGFTFTVAYIAIMALFVQKSCVVLSRDVIQYNSTSMFFTMFGAVAGWVLLRHLFLYYMNWLFDARDTVSRQMTVQLSVSIFSFLVMLPVLLLLLYNPYSLFVWLGFGIIALAAFIRFILEIVETRVATKASSFFIFLYFCSLEIAPTALLLTAGLRYFSQGSVF